MAEKTNMSADALRYYERIGLLPSVPRNAAGVRVYDEYFVQWIDFIKKLKASGMSLESIIDYIQLAKWVTPPTKNVRICWLNLKKCCWRRSTVCNR